LTASGLNRSTWAASSKSLYFVCLTVFGFSPSFVSIVSVESIAFSVSKSIVSEWRSSSSWFRTQAFQACDPGFKSRRPHQTKHAHFLIETSFQFQKQVVCRGWTIGEKLLPITPFAHYGSFSALSGGTLPNSIIMAFNFDSLSRLLWHLNRFISSLFFRKALRIKNHY
jgi:hypothetical protein